MTIIKCRALNEGEITMLIQIGTVTLYMDNPYFVEGFKRVQELYKRDCQLVPSRMTRLNVSEVLRYVAAKDVRGTGNYYFDEHAVMHAEEYIGVFMGYVSGTLPLLGQ